MKSLMFLAIVILFAIFSALHWLPFILLYFGLKK